MAEKTTAKAPAAAKAAATATPTENKAATPAVPAKPKTVDVFKPLKAIATDTKMAPQAKVIVNIIGTYPGGITRDDLVKALEGKIVTRQPIGRIVTYYQKTLADEGFISIEVVEVAKA